MNHHQIFFPITSILVLILVSISMTDVDATQLDSTAAARLIAEQGNDVVIPKIYTSIDNEVFQNSGITSVIIPDSVTHIGKFAFWFCTGLTGSLTIPDSVTHIGSGAFWGCSGLTGGLTIPDSVTTLVNLPSLNAVD